MDIKFSLNLLFFWIKGAISVDSRFVKTNLANTVLGFIPAGRDTQSIPLKNISSSSISTYYNIKSLIIGIVLIFIGLAMFSDSFILGLIVLLFGINYFFSGIKTRLIIEKGGTPYIISVPFFEKSKIIEVNNIIHQALADDTDKTDLNLFFDKKSN